jgi:transaldolase
MSELKKLQDAGQSVWLDNMRRDLLSSGTLSRYIQNLSVSGLTSNPTIFEKAISGSRDYDADIRRLAQQNRSPEETFFELALDDLRGAADLFRPIFDASGGTDGFVSLEVSPALAYDAPATIAQARDLFARAGRPNFLIKVPGTAEGVLAIEDLVAAGVPINVTLLFSVEHCEAAALAYLRGLERRLDAGLDLRVASVASLFISRWDAKIKGKVPERLDHKLGIAIGHRTYRVFRELFASPRWRRLAERGARPQRVLWASTGVKDPALPASYYVTALAARDTINTLPEATLLDFGQNGRVGALLGTDTRDAEQVMNGVSAAGVDLVALSSELQTQGAQSFVDSWNDLLRGIQERSSTLRSEA